MCRRLTFHGSDPLVIPPGMSVSLDCHGGRADLASYQGNLSLGEGASLALRNCSVSTYLPGDAAAVPANADAPFTLFGNSVGSLVEMEDSYLEAPCPVCLHPWLFSLWFTGLLRVTHAIDRSTELLC